MKYPKWIIEDIIKKKVDFHKNITAIETNKEILQYHTNTICYEAKCPNKGKCFSERHATFLILGKRCTRNCSFCSVEKGKPFPPDPLEPKRIADLVFKWNLKYAIFTSPTRDDLTDGGAEHFAQTVIEIRKVNPDTIIETLIPDFKGDIKSIKVVIDAKPDVISHNIEMVEKLYPVIRPNSDYKISLSVLKKIKEINPLLITKSSLIIGLGENMEEIKKTINDLKKVSCDILVVGQYLNPTKTSYPIMKFYTPDEFKEIENYAISTGFKSVVSKPLARTSYEAYYAYRKIKNEDIFS
jgi:lipoic acid synthetase